MTREVLRPSRVLLTCQRLLLRPGYTRPHTRASGQRDVRDVTPYEKFTEAGQHCETVLSAPCKHRVICFFPLDSNGAIAAAPISHTARVIWSDSGGRQLCLFTTMAGWELDVETRSTCSSRLPRGVALLVGGCRGLRRHSRLACQALNHVF